MSEEIDIDSAIVTNTASQIACYSENNANVSVASWSNDNQVLPRSCLGARHNHIQCVRENELY